MYKEDKEEEEYAECPRLLQDGPRLLIHRRAMFTVSIAAMCSRVALLCKSQSPSSMALLTTAAATLRVISRMLHARAIHSDTATQTLLHRTHSTVAHIVTLTHRCHSVVHRTHSLFAASRMLKCRLMGSKTPLLRNIELYSTIQYYVSYVATDERAMLTDWVEGTERLAALPRP